MAEHTIGYLSGAPRVSTRAEAELVGPKTHIIGVIQAFEKLGWNVKTFIVGDQVPLSWVKKGSETELHRSTFRVILSDLLRIGMGFLNSYRAYQTLGHEVEGVYERLAIFQALGWIFKAKKKYWILETNAPLFIEAKSDRNTIYFDKIAKFVELQAYKKCDYLVCVSEVLRDLIIDMTDIPSSKVIIVPNGVDISLFDPKLHTPIRLFEGFTIGFIGNLASWQGLDLLINAFSELREAGANINLVFVGDGPERQHLEKKIKHLQLSNFVKFVGFVPQNQVPKYISGFDIGYTGQTERTESRMYCSPIKLYEYMAMGVPPIASDYEDTRRAINKDCGYLFEINNKDDLKRVLQEAYTNQALLTQMGLRARAEIVKNHSWESRIAHLIEILEKKN